jgi:hypothetical protein
MMEINEKLIRDTMAVVRQHAASGGWDQRTFVSDCGTSFCFAGWALRLSGYGVEVLSRGTVYQQAIFISPEGERLTEKIGDMEYPDSGALERHAAAALGLPYNKTAEDEDGQTQAWFSIFYCFTGDVEELARVVQQATGVEVAAMNRESMITWAEALESGIYVKGEQHLAAGGRHCCLGVACEIAIAQGAEIERSAQTWGGVEYVYFDGADSLLPDSAQEWLGVATGNFHIPCEWVKELNLKFTHPGVVESADGTGTFAITYLNDYSNITFPQIAGLVRRMVAEYDQW